MIDDSRDARLDDWFEHGLTELAEMIGLALDIEAGLRDACLPGRLRSLDSALDAALDVDAGLAAIVSRDISPPPHEFSVPATVNDHPPTLAPLDELAWRVATRSFHGRLAFRSAIPLEELRRVRMIAEAFVDAADLVAGLEKGLASIRDHKRPGSLVADYDRALALSRALDLAHVDSALPSARGVVEAIARVRELVRRHALLPGAVVWARDLGLDLAAKVAVALMGELRRTFRRSEKHELGIALRDELIRFGDLGDVRSIALDRDDIRFQALRSPRELADGIARLDAVISDFTNADLTHVGLRGINLQGVRWSSSHTRWPLDWEDPIRHASVQIAPERRPDLYEIRDEPQVRYSQTWQRGAS